MKPTAFLAMCLGLVMLSWQALAMDVNQAARDIIDKVAKSGLEPELHGLIEFEAAREGYGPGHDPAIEISVPGEWAMIAYDGAGGGYYLLEDGRILFIDSEGMAGVVAKNFGAFIATVTSLPSWRDALRHVAPDDLDTARAQWLAYAEAWQLPQQYERGWAYGAEGYTYPTPRAGGEAVRAYFGVDEPADPFGALHEAVHGLNGDVCVSMEGFPFLNPGQ
jgi:hypothetical protein